MIFVHGKGEQNEDDVSVNFINLCASQCSHTIFCHEDRQTEELRILVVGCKVFDKIA